ncbi:class C sortase [Microbacterium testaceum]|uniref:class C sortase n=1 Tax=Microbacterium testaceum TaxID=2033 RepID=UPI0009BFDB0E|nr:class C sortase [Microbacterium testaceum]
MDRDRKIGASAPVFRSRSRRSRRRRQHPAGWRPALSTWGIAAILLAGAGVFLYPSVSQWLTSYNQSQIIEQADESLETNADQNAQKLKAAHAYNDALSSGVQVKANTNVPVGDGMVSGGGFDYSRLLDMTPDGMMARLKIDTIDVDLPVYHGTTDDVLLKGSGHLEGSSLPVGGEGTHAVLTAHRGLADAAMFTNLDKVKVGDTFVIEVFGEVLSYRVRETKVVDPEDTDSLRAQEGQDLVTLITCTPLGINTQRILVTGERITPTPAKDIAAAGEKPDIPGFPWWVFGILGSLAAASVYVWRSGYGDAVRRLSRRSRARSGADRDASHREPPRRRRRDRGRELPRAGGATPPRMPEGDRVGSAVDVAP